MRTYQGDHATIVHMQKSGTQEQPTTHKNSVIVKQAEKGCFPTWALIIIIVALVSGLGCVVWKYSNKKNNTRDQNFGFRFY
jgi:hypothetical protein